MRLLIGIILALLALFIAMFLVADARGLMDDSSVGGWLRALDGHGVWIVALTIAALLALDLFLPVPSSVIMTLSGYFLGAALGTLVSFAGAMASALIGFWLCRRFGRRGFQAAIGATETDRVESLFARYGDWTILLSRPVPMLTEVVSCVSGLSTMSGRRFALLSGAATLPLCALYGWAGQTIDGGAPAWMLLVAFVVPAAGFAALRPVTARRRATEISGR